MSEHPIDLTAIIERLGTHSVFGPSSSALYLNCSGGFIPHLLAEDHAGEDAAYGTVGHFVGETWLKTGKRPTELVGTVQVIKEGPDEYPIEIDDEMLDYVQEYVDWVMYLPGQHFVETRVDFSDITPIPNQTGTADHAVCEMGKLIITDLKMGKGIKVYAEKNSQGMLYAYGFFREWDWCYDFQEIEIRIAQPRLDHFDVWTISRQELLDFARWAKGRMALAWTPGQPRTPGVKQCQWCRVSGPCAARILMENRMMDDIFFDESDPITVEQVVELKKSLESDDYEIVPLDVYEMNTAHMAKLVKFRSLSENWWRTLYEELERRLNEGHDIPGYKLVEARSRRFFKDVKRAKEVLEIYGLTQDDIEPRKLISPSQAESKLMALGVRKRSLPSIMGSLTAKPPGKPTMVPLSDSRPALGSDLDEVFTDESRL